MSPERRNQRALVVSPRWGEQARRWLLARGVLDLTLRPGVVQRELHLPVQGDPGPELPPFPCRWESSTFVPFPSRAPRSFHDLAQVPEEYRQWLPRSYDVVGDIVVLRIPPPLAGQASRLGDALLRFVPGARLVAWDHGVAGPERKRRLEIVAGRGSLKTTHVENGLRLEVDLERAYFSPRLASEHARVAGLSRDGERVLDLFSGLAPFSLTLLSRLRHAASVAVDSNPGAIELARENASRARVSERFQAVCADAGEYLAAQAPAAYDRVIANLPHEAYKYAVQVGRVVKVGGQLHAYEIVPRGLRSRFEEALSAPGPERGSWLLRDRRKVHGYSPREDLVGLTLERTG
jgi:tRNA (guanine37-N1)-methyltransferase